jgi:hypothetical protein
MAIKKNLSRTAVRLAVMVLAVLGAATLTATSSQASPETSGVQAAASTHYWMVHKESGLCLDGSISQGIRLNTCSVNSRYQKWQVINQSTIKHVQSTRCVDGSISQGVRLNTCDNDSRYQMWYSTDNTGSYDLINRASGRCLDASVSQGVRLNSCNGSDYQQWWVNEI